jgi:pteridine reductase
VSKAAVVALMRGLALGLAPDVRVNAIAPGPVLPPEGYSKEHLERLQATVPLGRLGSAEDVARAVVFLAQNDYITGQVLGIDGGKSLG